MIFKTFCFLMFVQFIYSTSILEARIKNFSKHLEEEISATVSEACPEGWIESLEGCFYFHHTGEDSMYVYDINKVKVHNNNPFQPLASPGERARSSVRTSGVTWPRSRPRSRTHSWSASPCSRKIWFIPRAGK